jgi:hypothetical protein
MSKTMLAIGTFLPHSQLTCDEADTFFSDMKGGKGPITSLYMNPDTPSPYAEAQALVKIHSFGLNRMDLMHGKESTTSHPKQERHLVLSSRDGSKNLVLVIMETSKLEMRCLGLRMEEHMRSI